MANRKPSPIRPTNDTERSVANSERRVERARRALNEAIADRSDVVVFAHQHDGMRVSRIAAVANYARQQIGAEPITEQAIAAVLTKANTR